jgi:PAS domain S-box-containing protein
VEAAYRVLAEQASELVCRHSRDSTLRYVSSASQQLLGQSPEQLLGTAALTLIDAADREQAGAVLRALLSGYSEQARFVARYHKPGGQSVRLEVTAYPVHSAAGGPIEEYVTVARELAHAPEHALELQALERKVARMSALLEAVPGMIYQWKMRADGSREFTYCNQWPRKVFGIDPSELSLLAERLGARAHPDDVKMMATRWERARDTLEPWSWRGRFFTGPGEVLHVVGHARADKQPDGTVLWSGVLLDDSAQRRVEDALLQSNELFGTVVSNMEVAHLRLDVEGEILSINAAGQRMFGCGHAGELVGLSAARELWLSPARFDELRAQVMRDGMALFDGPLQKRDGSVCIAQGALRLQRDASGVAIAIDGVLRDVTGERKASDALVDAREAAEAGSRAKSVFLANMSQEIRTPMNAIIGLSDLALDADPPPRQRKYLTQIHAAGVTLLDIINDILDVSKIEAGKIALEHEPFEVDRMLDAVANVISVRAAERKLEVIFAVDPSVPEVLVGDRMRLGQVLMNLAANAVKFTERGEIVISLDLVRREGDEATVRFAVRDSGMGMSREQQGRLFEPFSQVDGSSGAGLGLAISQELVLLMGGRIEVESAPDAGSEFHFELALDVDVNASVTRGRVPRDMREVRVLVVDDSQAAREVLTRSLLAMGLAVCAVPSAKAALETLALAEQRGAPYQVALIDVRMSETDGLELARHIEEDRALRHKPSVVMMSASEKDELEAGRDLSQVRALLRKPISRSTLFDTIIALMNDPLLQRSAAEVPVTAAPAGVLAQPAPAASIDASARKKPLAGLNVMVVEDNEINQILARDLLEAAGAQITLASDGREALRLAAEREPGFDAIMMDVQMPGMDGHTTTRALRLEAKTAHTPIIAMTAHAFDAERAKCLASGMNAHVAKPINPRELVQTIQLWARGARDAALPAAASTPASGSAEKRSEPDFDETALGAVFKDPARQLAFLRKFIDAAQRALTELEPAWSARDHAQIGFAGHKLKSSAKACGANRLAWVFAELERLAKTESWPALDARRRELPPLLDQIEKYVSAREAEAR